MTGFSFFGKRAFLNTNHEQEFEPSYPVRRGHLLRVSSMIRIDQIAERLGARVNPESGYDDDVCIYVKPNVPYGRHDFDYTFPKRAYLDIIDGYRLGQFAAKHPQMGVIACSQQDAEILRTSIPNRVVLIPQHHCNFERATRACTGVARVGCIGLRGAFDYLPLELEQALADRGITLELCSRFCTRQDVVDF